MLPHRKSVSSRMVSAEDMLDDEPSSPFSCKCATSQTPFAEDASDGEPPSSPLFCLCGTTTKPWNFDKISDREEFLHGAFLAWISELDDPLPSLEEVQDEYTESFGVSMNKDDIWGTRHWDPWWSIANAWDKRLTEGPPVSDRASTVVRRWMLVTDACCRKKKES